MQTLFRLSIETLHIRILLEMWRHNCSFDESTKTLVYFRQYKKINKNKDNFKKYYS